MYLYSRLHDCALRRPPAVVFVHAAQPCIQLAMRSSDSSIALASPSTEIGNGRHSCEMSAALKLTANRPCTNCRSTSAITLEHLPLTNVARTTQYNMRQRYGRHRDCFPYSESEHEPRNAGQCECYCIFVRTEDPCIVYFS